MSEQQDESFAHDKYGIPVFPIVAFIESCYQEIAINVFYPTSSYPRGLGQLQIDYTWQAISITNSIASISFSNRSDKLEVCARLCRKAAQAFAEAERVRQEILKRGGQA